MRKDDEKAGLGTLTSEFDKLRKRILGDVNRLHELAGLIDRRASADGNPQVALVARASIRTVTAMGHGLSRMRAMQTAERKDEVRKVEEDQQEKLKEAAAQLLAERRAASQAAQVAAQPSVAQFVANLGRGYGGRP